MFFTLKSQGQRAAASLSVSESKIETENSESEARDTMRNSTQKTGMNSPILRGCVGQQTMNQGADVTSLETPARPTPARHILQSKFPHSL